MKLPYAAVEFTKDGHVADPSQVTEALAMLDRVRATDVLVLAHGWNNDIGAAERLYTHLTDNLADLIPAGSAARPAVIGILWPSVRWADEDQIAGGGVSIGDDLTTLASAIAESVDDPDLAGRLTELAGRLETPEGRAAFLEATRDLLPAPVAPGGADEDPAPAALRTGVPIVPLSVVGAEEIYPLVGNIPSLARLLGVHCNSQPLTWSQGQLHRG